MEPLTNEQIWGVPDDELPECTDEQLWKENKWAVMKRGAKRAVSGGVKDNEMDAVNMAADLGPDYYVEARPGKARACKYCDARQFCHQYKRLDAAGELWTPYK